MFLCRRGPPESGQGSGLAGVITAIGPDVSNWSVGDEVVGWVDTRSSQAEYAVVPADHLITKPAAVSWSAAGGLFVAGATAWAAVRAVGLKPGEVVVVSGAAGGVGGLVVQLALEHEATVLGVAGPANQVWLSEHRVTAISHAEGLEAVEHRIRKLIPNGVDAFIDSSDRATSSSRCASGFRPTGSTRSSTSARSSDTGCGATAMPKAPTRPI